MGKQNSREEADIEIQNRKWVINSGIIRRGDMWGDYLRLECVKFVFCLEIHARAEYTLNARGRVKFSCHQTE